MPSPRRLSILLVVLVLLAGVAVPPLIEDHFEPGFCSADCPVQHAGYGALTPSPSRRRAEPTPIAA